MAVFAAPSNAHTNPLTTPSSAAVVEQLSLEIQELEQMAGDHLVELMPLDHDEKIEYFRHCLSLPPKTVIPESILTFVVDMSEGNPVHMEEIVDILVNMGVLCVDRVKQIPRVTEGRPIKDVADHMMEWRWSSVVAEKMARIERLTPDKKLLVKLASGFKDFFSVADITYVWRMSRRTKRSLAMFLEVYGLCMDLTQQDIFEADGTKTLFRFRSKCLAWVSSSLLMGSQRSLMVRARFKASVKRCLARVRAEKQNPGAARATWTRARTGEQVDLDDVKMLGAALKKRENRFFQSQKSGLDTM